MRLTEPKGATSESYRAVRSRECALRNCTEPWGEPRASCGSTVSGPVERSGMASSNMEPGSGPAPGMTPAWSDVDLDGESSDGEFGPKLRYLIVRTVSVQ